MGAARFRTQEVVRKSLHRLRRAAREVKTNFRAARFTGQDSGEAHCAARKHLVEAAFVHCGCGDYHRFSSAGCVLAESEVRAVILKFPSAHGPNSTAKLSDGFGDS